ncbi:MAG: tetratricopeptide repeat protein [Pseudomonadota bacterium]
MPVSSCEPRSLVDFETALTQLQSYFGDPVETLDATLERDPGFVLGHVFRASALLMMCERQYLPEARASIDRAEALGHANDRERGLIKAVREWLDGHWDRAGHAWDAVLADYPRDALALQFGHLTDFYLGDAVNLRDRVGRVIGHWDPMLPGYSYVRGMQAFGLEECNHFDRAEEVGREALDLERRDPWAIHAVAHVMEMQNRHGEGRSFLRDREQDWAPDNGLAFHNWWHLALFHIEDQQFAEALKLYDNYVSQDMGETSLQMVDASALLWRLRLMGVELGDRWQVLADLWLQRTPVENGFYAFNDLHALIAAASTGRLAQAREIQRATEAAARDEAGVTGMMARLVGVPCNAAFLAFAEERYNDAVVALAPVRSIANRFGGSNAQRDILNQTLIEAAIRSGQAGLAANLVNERAEHKPLSRLTARFRRRSVDTGRRAA